MLSFIGWEAVSHLAGELRDPARQLPRAIFAALAIVVVLYLGLAIATIGVLGTAAPSDVPLADLMAAGLGEAGRSVTAGLAVLLTMGAMNAYVAAAVKLAGALAEEGAAPRALGRPRAALALLAAGGRGAARPARARRRSASTGSCARTSAAFVAVYVAATAAGVRLLDGAARVVRRRRVRGGRGRARVLVACTWRCRWSWARWRWCAVAVPRLRRRPLRLGSGVSAAARGVPASARERSMIAPEATPRSDRPRRAPVARSARPPRHPGRRRTRRRRRARRKRAELRRGVQCPPGRNSASGRNVHGCTSSPAACASATSEVGSPRRPSAVARDQLVLVRADRVGVGRDLRHVGRRPGRQPHERVPRALAQLPQVAGLEGLDEHRPAEAVQRGQQRRLEREPERGEVRRVLGLGVDADARARGERDHLLERRDPEAAVERGAAQLRQPLPRAQRAQLGEREVLGEPAVLLAPVDRLDRPARRELRALRDVGRARDLVLVARDEPPVARRDHVGLDEVGAELDRELVGRERVLGPERGGAAVGDHDGRRRHGRSQPQNRPFTGR